MLSACKNRMVGVNMKPSLYERIEVWNERRIERLRLKAPFRKTSEGFSFKGIKSQFDPNWEPLTRKLVQSYSATDASFVNVGAHYGYYACLAAYCGMNVTAFEPIDANYKMLRDNIAYNDFFDRCRIIHGAVGAYSHITKIYGAFSGATLLPENTRKPKSMYQVTQVFTLSDIEIKKEKTLFLMDVEGFELNVISGAAELVDDTHNNSWIIETSGENLSSLGARMIDQGYSLFHIGKDKLLQLHEDDLIGCTLQGNFLFTNVSKESNLNIIMRFS